MISKTALILAAHGARDCPHVGDIIRQQAATIASQSDFAAVACAFNQDQPHFREVLDQLLDRFPDIDRAVVVPVMTSGGYFADQFLPESLRQNQCADKIDIRITPPLGTHPRVATQVIRRIEQLANVFDVELDSASIIVVGHGTPRNDSSSHATEKLAEQINQNRDRKRPVDNQNRDRKGAIRIQSRDRKGAIRHQIRERKRPVHKATFPQAQARPAFLDQDPLLENVAKSIPSGDVLVIPFLISPGPHALIDIPTRLGIKDASLNRAASASDRSTFRAATVRERSVIRAASGSDRSTFRTATVRERTNFNDAQQPEKFPQQPGFESSGQQGTAATPRLYFQNQRRILIDRPTGLDPKMIDCIMDLAQPRKTGSVHLVGAGPGDPELITTKGAQLVADADAIVHDRLIPRELLRTARPGARVINVAKHPDGSGADQTRINRVLIRLAQRGMNVVRLKGGDPFVFGRGFEEYEACRAAGVPCHVIPGVSSAIAAPAAANIPMTHRRLARSVAIITASFADGDQNPLDFAALARIDTVVILMGRSKLFEVSRGLIAAGKPPDTPAACIENATTSKQRIVRADLAHIAGNAAAVGLRTPTVTIVGDVAALSGDWSQSAVADGVSDMAMMS